MLFNIVIGFIIPWAFGIWLFNKDKRIITFIFPFSSVIAYLANSLGYYFNFWRLEPTDLNSFSALPLIIGYFPIMGSFLIYIVHHKNKNKNPYIVIIIYCFFTTVNEYIGVISKRVIYLKEWNIFYTYISYIIPYTLVYWYYVWIKSPKIFSKSKTVDYQ